MKIIEMVIDENDHESGIDAVSLVEDPAIQLNFVALNKHQEVKLAEVDGEKRILMGAALVPNKPIYRNQGGEEFYIYFTQKTVRRASELFFKRGYQNNVTEDHAIALDNNTVVESWIKEHEAHDKSVAFGLEAPVGTWFISMKIEDEETYKKAKDGTLKGFSIEGFFADALSVKQSAEKPTPIETIKKMLNEIETE
jgi:hypothetical protein